MNKIFNKWVLAAALICSCLTYLSAQPTREQLAQIRVDKEGLFKRMRRGGMAPEGGDGGGVDIMTRQLGQKPILTFGNSSGDYPMFEFVTTGNRYPSMAFCLLCDDVERELGNEAKAEKCRKDCEANGWVPVSMRDDWTTIYGPDVRPTATAVRSVSRVAESHGRAYTIGGLPATDQTQGIVISDQKKTVRR